MTKFTSTVLILFSFTILFSCQEEELSPNEEAAKSQQAGIDIHNGGGNTGLIEVGKDDGSSVDENATSDTLIVSKGQF